MSGVSSTRSLQAKLADLHIFVVPLDLWLDKYRTAFNNIALESVSAGFVRVHPDLTLHHLRECLEEQLGEEVIPEDFIFLRSVGRCMAVVKENQERLLKVSDFLPPVAYSPEIFLLPGSHETYARPASDSNNVIIATHGYTTAGMSTTNPFHLPVINQQNLIAQPGYLNQPDHYGNQRLEEEDFHGNLPVDNRDTDYYQNQEQRDSFDGQVNSSYEDSSHDNNMHIMSLESQDADLTPRDEKKDKLSRESKTKKTRIQEDKDVNEKKSVSPPVIKTVKIIEPEVVPVHFIPYQGPDGRLVAPPTPIPSGRVIASPIPGPRKSKSDKTQNTTRESKKKNKNKTKQKARSRSPSLERQKIKQTEEKENVPTVPADDYVIPSIEDVEERSKYAQFPSPAKTTRDHSLYENEMDSGIADDFVTPPHGLNDSLNSNMDNKDKLNYRGDNMDGRIDDYMDHLHHGEAETDNLLNKNKEYPNSLAAKTNHNKTDNKTDRQIKQGIGKNDKNVTRKPKKTVKKTVKKTDDDLNAKLEKLKTFEPPPIAMPDPGSVSFERDTHSAKERKHKVIEELRGQLRKAKNERVDLEKQRDQKVRRAKSLQTQTLQKRNQAKNIWKKKFFDEKRKSAPLEEQLNRLRYDVEIQHKAIVSLLEDKDNTGSKSGQEQDNIPSEKTNQLMLLARIQNEVDELKHKIEEVKLRLASEMKLRDNAQSEVKQLREDLIHKKINLTLTKSQKSLMVLNNTENITA